MAEQEKASAKASGGSGGRVSDGSNAHVEANEASTAVGTPVAGRRQLGEALPAEGVSTRVPRGVNEAPANAVAEGPAGDAQKRVKEQVDRENEQGFRGSRTDPTPNEAYTVRGVTSGQPTPETTVVTPKGQ